VAIFVLPSSAPRLRRGSTRAIAAASDFQEAKNITTFSPNLIPNTAFRYMRLRVVRGTTATWLLPQRRGCLRGRQTLLVVASSTGRVRAVRFLDGRRRIATDRRGLSGLYSVTWRANRARKGRHRLRAIVASSAGRKVVSRSVRVCK
jgi:hypothetical protein